MRPRPAALLGALLLFTTAAPLLAQNSSGEAYTDYAEMLARYLSNGAVDYERWKADDPPAWRRFLGWLESTDPSEWTVADQQAFWLNAYNARVIAGVLQRYPLDSVRSVGLFGGRFGGFFSRREHPVAGRTRTLDEIEKEILLQPPLWDARIHWALSCASRSCPNLRPEPYRGSILDRQLDFQASTYLNSPSGHRLEPEERVIRLTRILDWYRDDFRRAADSVRNYAMRYLTGASLEALRAGWEIRYLDYDWTLNDARRSRVGSSAP